MNCHSCKENISAQMTAAFTSNVCPFCGNALLAPGKRTLMKQIDAISMAVLKELKEDSANVDVLVPRVEYLLCYLKRNLFIILDSEERYEDFDGRENREDEEYRPSKKKFDPNDKRPVKPITRAGGERLDEDLSTGMAAAGGDDMLDSLVNMADGEDDFSPKEVTDEDGDQVVLGVGDTAMQEKAEYLRRKVKPSKFPKPVSRI